MRDQRCRDFHVHLEGALVVPLALRKKLLQPAISWPVPGRDAMTEFLAAFRRMKAERLRPGEISTIVSESVACLPRRCSPNGADLRIAFRSGRICSAAAMTSRACTTRTLQSPRDYATRNFRRTSISSCGRLSRDAAETGRSRASLQYSTCAHPTGCASGVSI